MIRDERKVPSRQQPPPAAGPLANEGLSRPTERMNRQGNSAAVPRLSLPLLAGRTPPNELGQWR